jgi:hypothetical protein
MKETLAEHDIADGPSADDRSCHSSSKMVGAFGDVLCRTTRNARGLANVGSDPLAKSSGVRELPVTTGRWILSKGLGNRHAARQEPGRLRTDARPATEQSRHADVASIRPSNVAATGGCVPFSGRTAGRQHAGEEEVFALGTDAAN